MQAMSSEVNHSAITDHTIPRRPRRGLSPSRRSTPGPDDLAPFLPEGARASKADLARNLGTALMHMLDRSPPAEYKAAYARKALPLLDKAVTRDPEDFPAREARGDALWVLGRQEEALADYQAILSARPDLESTLGRAGELLLVMNCPQEARTHLERLVRLSPGHWRHHHLYAQATFRLRDWAAATDACKKALRIEPFQPGTRSLLIQCYLVAGHPQRAEKEYQTLKQLTPEAKRDSLRRWYDEARKRFAGP
jgi:tetratricopeptide (TPR) repeat protein